MRGRTARRVIVVALLGAVVGGPGAARALAAEGSATLRLALEIQPRAVALADRPAVTLVPGRATTVMVTVKARVPAGSAVSVDLAAGPGAARVEYGFLGRRGRLGDAAPLGLVAGSGVHVLPLTLSLPAGATGPVTLPLALAASPYGPALAGLTRVAP